MVDNIQTFQSRQIQKILGVSKQFINHNSRTGIVEPFQDSSGKGTARIFTINEVLKFAVVRDLLKAHIQSPTLKLFLFTMDGLNIDEFKRQIKIKGTLFHEVLRENPQAIVDMGLIAVFPFASLQPEDGYLPKTVFYSKDSFKKVFYEYSEFHHGNLVLNISALLKSIIQKI